MATPKQIDHINWYDSIVIIDCAILSSLDNERYGGNPVLVPLILLFVNLSNNIYFNLRFYAV